MGDLIGFSMTCQGKQKMAVIVRHLQDGGFEYSATLSASARSLAAMTYRLSEPNFARPEEDTF